MTPATTSSAKHKTAGAAKPAADAIALSLHARVGEEIFHPDVKAALKDGPMVPEASVEHAGLNDLIVLALGARMARRRAELTAKPG